MTNKDPFFLPQKHTGPIPGLFQISSQMQWACQEIRNDAFAEAVDSLHDDVCHRDASNHCQRLLRLLNH